MKCPHCGAEIITDLIDFAVSCIIKGGKVNRIMLNDENYHLVCVLDGITYHEEIDV